MPYRTVVGLKAGLVGKAEMTVTDADTAVALRSGDVPVLGSPRLVALCEEAACAAVGGGLLDGHTTVGSGIQFHHLAPTPIGELVTAEATLEKIEGRRLSFTVSANDPAGLVGAGRMTRVIVETGAFLAKAKRSP